MGKDIEMLAEFGEKYLKLGMGKILVEVELYFSLSQKMTSIDESLKAKALEKFDEVKSSYEKLVLCGVDMTEYENRIKFLDDKLK